MTDIDNAANTEQTEIPEKHVEESTCTKWQLWQIAITLLVLLSLASWVYQQYNYVDTPYYIALAGPMQQANGESMYEAVQLLLDDVNAKGGIDHHPVKLLVFDDNNQVEQARHNAQQLIADDRVLGIIGHYSSGITSQVAPLYAEAGIPAITASATTDSITENSEWYFRTTFNNTDQATLLANYAYKVLGHKTANIISVDSVFGESLAKAFEQAAKDIGLTIVHHWHYAAQDTEQRKQVFEQLITTYQTSDTESSLFIAAGSSDSINIITSLQRLAKPIPVLGSDAFASNNFQMGLRELPQERAKPGYFTENIYVASPFLEDIANRQAQDMKHRYLHRYGHSPSTTAAMYYDATLTLITALRKISTDTSAAQKRQQVKVALQNMTSFATGIEGITGQIYFDKEGDMIRTIPIAQYKSGKMIVAAEQFQPITDVSNIGKLLEEALGNQVIHVNGKFMRRAQVVYTGIEFNELTELDVNEGTFLADFYVWFRFHKGFEFDDSLIEFMNTQDIIRLEEPYWVESSEIEPDLITKIYRVKTHFKAQFDFHHYPLDRQILPIEFIHEELFRDRLIYVVDAQGMNLAAGHKIIERLQQNHVFNISGWHLENILYFQDTLRTDSSWGIPDLFNAQKSIESSQFNVNIQIERNVLNFILKNTIPVIFLILLGYLSYYLSIKDALGVRMTLSVNMIVATSLFHLKWATTMSNVDYLVLMEYLFFAIYFLALFNIAINAIFYYKDVEAEKLTIKRINLLAKFFYLFFILGLIGTVGYFYME